MKTPVEIAAEVYEREACARSFREDVEAHLLNGFVFSTPDFFIMGRAVERDAAPTLILDPLHAFPRESCDCWHIWLFAGNMERAWSIMPWSLKWFSFERKNELRFYSADAIRRLSSFPTP